MASRRTLLLCALALLATAGGCGDGGAGMLVADPPAIDFGRVVWKDTAERSFELRNEGSHTVLVTDVVPNCACFEVRPFRRTLAPGERREVRVRFISERVPPTPLRGKKLEVLSDDPQVPMLQVNIEGIPFATHTITPPQVEMDLLDDAGRMRRWTVEIRAVEGTQLEAGPAQISPPDVLGLEARARPDGVDLEIRVDEDATIGAGRLKGWVSLPIDLTLPDGTRRRTRETVRIEGDWP